MNKRTWKKRIVPNTIHITHIGECSVLFTMETDESVR